MQMLKQTYKITPKLTHAICILYIFVYVYKLNYVHLIFFQPSFPAFVTLSLKHFCLQSVFFSTFITALLISFTTIVKSAIQILFYLIFIGILLNFYLFQNTLNKTFKCLSSSYLQFYQTIQLLTHFRSICSRCFHYFNIDNRAFSFFFSKLKLFLLP